MPDRHPFQRTTAFIASFLLVTWIGGSLGAAGFKAVYWLCCGVWPDTALHGLVPEAVLGPLLVQSGNGGPDAWLLGLLRLDILTLILAAPPLLLLPFLAAHLTGRAPEPLFTRLRHPFAAPSSRNHGSAGSGPGNDSNKSGTTQDFERRGRPGISPAASATMGGARGN